jgi:hypothetical protein
VYPGGGRLDLLGVGHFKRGSQLSRRVAPYVDVEYRGVQDPVTGGCAPVPSGLWAEHELDFAEGLGWKSHALKAFEFTDRTRGGAVPLVQIELYDLGSFAVGGVGDLDRDGDRPVQWNRGLVDGEV